MRLLGAHALQRRIWYAFKAATSLRRRRRTRLAVLQGKWQRTRLKAVLHAWAAAADACR